MSYCKLTSSGRVGEMLDLLCSTMDATRKLMRCTATSSGNGRTRESCLCVTPSVGPRTSLTDPDMFSESHIDPCLSPCRSTHPGRVASCCPDTSYHWTDHIRNRIIAERADFVDSFFKHGAKVYICGSPQLSDGVKQAVVTIWSEHEGKTEEEGWEWMRADGKDRFATDVFL